MAHMFGQRHSKLPTGSVIHTRQPEQPITPDTEIESTRYMLAALTKVHEQLDNLARLTENRSHVVDEYQPETLATDTETQISVIPTYEYMNEKIESVIVTGPPSATVTLQLGDRFWSLVIPASGILVIGYIGILLGRNDPRVLTASVAGDYGLELCGVADRRYNI
jgi:hypothetical protein